MNTQHRQVRVSGIYELKKRNKLCFQEYRYGVADLNHQAKTGIESRTCQLLDNAASPHFGSEEAKDKTLMAFETGQVLFHRL